jgi:hypothetical protein
MMDKLPLVHAALSSHLVSTAVVATICALTFRMKLLIEQQLNDSREWLFDTLSPSLADISLHFILAFVISLSRHISILDDNYPFTTEVGLQSLKNYFVI